MQWSRMRSVGLVAHHPVDVVQSEVGLGENAVDAAGMASTAKRNTARPSMVSRGPAGRAHWPEWPCCPGHPAGWRRGRLAPASKTAAPAPSPNSTQVLRSVMSIRRLSTSTPDDQGRRGGRSGARKPPGRRHRVPKAGAGCVYIQHRNVLGQAQLSLYQTGKAGGGVIRRDSGAQHTAKTGRGNAAARQRLTGGPGGQREGGFPLRRRSTAGGCRCGWRSTRRWCPPAGHLLVGDGGFGRGSGRWPIASVRSWGTSHSWPMRRYFL